MNGFGFQKNTNFEWKGVVFKIVATPPNDELLLEAINTGAMSVVPLKQLLDEYAAGQLKAVVDPPNGDAKAKHFSRPLDELPENVRAEVKRRHHYINSIMRLGRPVFTQRYLAPLLQQAAEAINDSKPPSTVTFYRWYTKLYSAKGETRALVPRFDRRGGRSGGTSAQVLALMMEAVNEIYKVSPLAKTGTVYARLLSKIERMNQTTTNLVPLKAPSLRTLHRFINKVDAYDMAVLREGKASADRRFRMVKLGKQATHILSCVEADHTPLDLFLIDERTWLPLGRPTVTVLLDKYSRMPLGYAISFGPPSAEAVVEALRHAILPKKVAEQVLRDLPIEHDWPCYGIPYLLLLDNGLEFHGVDLENIALDLWMVLQYCPKRAPQFKGAIERFLKTVNYGLAHQLAGTSFSKFHLRGDYNPLDHAVLTMAEFKNIFEKWILDVYSVSLHRGLNTTPRAKWLEGLKEYSPQLPPNLDILARRIGHHTTRALTGNGLGLNHIRYSDESLLQPIVNRYGNGVRVRVVFDAQNLGTVQVWDPEEEDPVSVKAVDYGYANNLTLRQHRLIEETLRAEGRSKFDAAAANRAKDMISRQVEELMVSRSLKARKRSAAIRGLSSSKPDGAGVFDPAASAAQEPRRRTPKPTTSRPESEDQLPEILKAFEMTSGTWTDENS